jgi:hypothetical protein
LKAMMTSTDHTTDTEVTRAVVQTYVPARSSGGRLGALALALAGLMFVLYPAVRPWHDESTLTGARTSMSSDAWVAAHLFAMIGLVLLPLGLLGLRGVLDRTGGAAPGRAAVALSWAGAALTLPYYGAEDFALHAIARSAAGGSGIDLLGLVHDIRFDPVMTTMAGTGLVLLALGGILLSVAVWRAGTLPRWSGVLVAIDLVLFVPQFYLPEWARIGHGVLLGIGLVWLAAGLWTASGGPTRAGLRPPVPTAQEETS